MMQSTLAPFPALLLAPRVVRHAASLAREPQNLPQEDRIGGGPGETWKRQFLDATVVEEPQGMQHWCDNNDKHAANPDPTKTVRQRAQTFDEMQLEYVVSFVPGPKPGESTSRHGGRHAAAMLVGRASRGNAFF